MWDVTHELFDDLANKCGNRYLATMYIAKVSRKLNYQVPGGALTSKLITWAITGVRPDFKYNFIYHQNLSTDLATLEYYLEYVCDEDIKYCVRYSYIMSLRKHHLIYYYKRSMDQYQESRTRVILRMVWSENVEVKESN